MPNTHTSQSGDNKPQNDRPVSHFDKRRTHTHSGHTNTNHRPSHHEKQISHHSSTDAHKPRHSGHGASPKKFFGSMRQNQ
jgi:hypothetical protein